MIYLPDTVRLEQRGLLVLLRGVDEVRDGRILMDFHALLGKYEKEEELARTIVNSFNSFMELHSGVSPDYPALLELYKYQQRELNLLNDKRRKGKKK